MSYVVDDLFGCKIDQTCLERMKNSAPRSIMKQKSADRHPNKRKCGTLPVADCV